MRMLGISVVVGTTLLALVPPAVARAPLPVGTTTTVRADCLVGPGSVTLRQTTREPGSTRVTVAGHDVRNGQWDGGYTLGAGRGSSVVGLRAIASDRELRTSFTIDRTARTSDLSLRSGRRHACGVYLGDRPTSTFFGTPELTLVARYPAPGELTTRIYLADCRDGSRWRYSAQLDYRDHAIGWTEAGLVCRDGSVRTPRTPMTSDSGERPIGIKVVFRSSTGQHRAISYQTEGPA